MKIVIISWSGQHDKARKIYDDLSSASDGCQIIYSEPGEKKCFEPEYDSIRRPDSSFWGDKFKTAVNACQDDTLLIVHADCQCRDWQALLNKCTHAFNHVPGLAVWAPLILGTPYPLRRTLLGNVEGTSLKKVAQTDGLVVALRRDVVKRMLDADYSQNVYGWGIDWMFVSFAQSAGNYAAVDTSIIVKHSVGRRYSDEEAISQMKEFLKQLTSAEKDEYRYLSDHVLKQS